MSFKGSPQDKEILEELERKSERRRVPEAEIDNYHKIESLLEDGEEAEDYLVSYYKFFGEYEGALDYLRQWEEEIGDTSEIIESLEE